MSSSLKSFILLLLFVLYCFLLNPVSALQTNTTIGTNSTVSNSTTSYASKDEVAALRYQLSLLQVVVIVNSAIVGCLLLVVGALTSIKCYEDYDPNAGVRMEDPLWLKLFGIFNWFAALVLCQCFDIAKPKGKKIEVIDTNKWRQWHIRDLELQNELFDETELIKQEETEEDIQIKE